MMEIIYHKCEFVGEMTVVQQAQRQLSLASYERIEQTLKECIAAKLLPANLLHPAGGRVNAQLPFRADGKLAVCPPIRSTCMRKRGTTSLFCWRCINSARRYAARRACQLKGSARMGVNF